MNVRDLRYSIESAIYVVFVPREFVEEILMIRDRVGEPITWGDARALFSSRWYDELRDQFLTPDEATPPDDQAMDWDEGIGVRWPQVRYDEILGWLPDEIIEEYGEPYDGMVDSGVHMPASREQEIIQALVAAGYTCAKDDRIVEEELFDYQA